MPVITIALMGFFAFGGGPVTPPEVPTTVMGVEEDKTILALKDPVEVAHATGEDVYTVTLTSYNAVAEQTDANPLITASGAATNAEVIAARSVDLAGVLPFGTIVAIERAGEDTSKCHFGTTKHLIGYRVIADSMHSRKRNQVDVLFDQHDTVVVTNKEMNPSIALGVCSGVSVRVLGKIKVADIPATQEELRMIIEGDSLAMR